MIHDLARVGVTDADLPMLNDPRAYAWRMLAAEHDRLSLLVAANVDGFSSAFVKELYGAKAALEDAIGLVVVDLRATIGKKAPAKRVRKRGRPLGSKTKSAAEKNATDRTLSIPGTDDPKPTTNGAPHVGAAVETAPV